jgi:hypothetical protein
MEQALEVGIVFFMRLQNLMLVNGKNGMPTKNMASA